MFNYLIVGSGLYGATVAQQLNSAGKSVLVIDKRPNIGGNVYTEDIEGIHVHRYGAHIFHTNNRMVWDIWLYSVSSWLKHQGVSGREVVYR